MNIFLPLEQIPVSVTGLDAFWSALGGTVVNHGDFFVVNPIEENFLKIGSGDLLDLVHLGGECGRVATDNSLKTDLNRK